MHWQDPVTVIKGIGKAAEQRLAVLGIHTVGDLLQYYPRTYRDYSQVVPIRALADGADVISNWFISISRLSESCFMRALGLSLSDALKRAMVNIK